MAGFQKVSIRLHVVGRREGVCHLVDETEPAADICQVARSGERLDRLQHLRAWPDGRRCDLEARKGYDVLSEAELRWILDDPVAATSIEPLYALVEGFLHARSPEESVVHTFRLVGYVRNNGVKPSRGLMLYPHSTI